MYDFLLVLYILIALILIGLVLIQQGKGADMGASFGSGASATVFGSTGSANFLSRMTSLCAILFFVISLILAKMSSGSSSDDSAWNNIGLNSNKSEQIQKENIGKSETKVNGSKSLKSNSPESEIPK